MTNEEKAKEIARDYKRPASSLEAEIACESALEMAQWKDQQFKEYLEKKKEDIMNNPYTGHCLSDIYLIDEIIAELFPNN